MSNVIVTLILSVLDYRTGMTVASVREQNMTLAACEAEIASATKTRARSEFVIGTCIAESKFSK